SVDPMQIFDLDDEWALATAVQAQLRQHGTRAGLVLFGTESGEPLRLAGTPEQVQEIGCGDGRIHADFLQTSVYLRRHDRRTIHLSDATGMPEEGAHWLRGHGLPIGHALPLDIRV